MGSRPALLLVLFLGGCGEGASERSNPAATDAAGAVIGNGVPAPGATPGPAAAAVDPQLLDKWSRSCALCHVDGTGGAPRLGDTAAWAPRLEAGEAAMLRHTVEGLDNMPPLGYCMDCSRDDFLQLIRFMAEGDAEA